MILVTGLRSTASVLLVATISGCGTSNSSGGNGAGAGNGFSGNGSGGEFTIGTGGGGGGGANGGNGDFGGNGNAGGSRAINADAACVAERRGSEQLPVDLYFMVDITGSMNCPVGPDGMDCTVDPGPPYAATTRWSEESQALKAFFSSAGNDGQGAGIAFFPSQNNVCNAASYTQPAVEIATLPGAQAALNAAVDAQVPAGNTPTVASLTGATQHASDWAKAHPDRRVAVVYSTDGYPVGCNGNTIAAAAQVAQNAFTATPSVPTYVLGVGYNLTSLNQIAMAGGTNQAYLIDTGQDIATQLAMALGSIRGRAITCDYKLPASSGGKLDYNYVNIETKVGSSGTPQTVSRVANAAACDATTGGWYYDNESAPTSIILCARTCDPLIGTEGSELQVLVGCMSNTRVN